MSDNHLNSYVNHYCSLLLLGNLDVDFVYRRPSLSGEQEAWALQRWDKNASVCQYRLYSTCP